MIVVQNDGGTEVGANAYIDADWFKNYHDARGNTYTGADQDLERAIIKATDYLDERFTFVGRRRMGRDQTTEWPRTDAWDRDRRYINDVPQEVKEATAEYALRALTQDINPDPERDPTGRVLRAKSEQVGPISESVTFAPGAVYQLPAYPAADRKLIKAGLVRPGGTLRRG